MLLVSAVRRRHIRGNAGSSSTTYMYLSVVKYHPDFRTLLIR